jgi:hypothetical protein
MTQTFTFRLTAQGVQQLEQQLQSLGARGQAATSVTPGPEPSTITS